MNSTAVCGVVAIHTVSQNPKSAPRPEKGTEDRRHIFFKFIWAGRNFSADPGL